MRDIICQSQSLINIYLFKFKFETKTASTIALPAQTLSGENLGAANTLVLVACWRDGPDPVHRVRWPALEQGFRVH